ncbi:MAG: type II toxin-antitoxin system HicA family toxin [Planctomycetaceae bacterium]|nr:type II toxin-antitoxin system HicA family toxin [Planctomycetales bacterium]MCB9921685.1 type II toxin-antitoxin system HicA family toxin [Planctomycetaceae bacterium]
MTVDEVIKLLESDGWRQTNNDESCRQYKHDSKTKIVTLSGQLDTLMPKAVLRSLLRHVQLNEGT